MQNQIRTFFLIVLFTITGNLTAQETIVSFDAVTGQSDAVPNNGGPCTADASDICDDMLSFEGGALVIDANTLADGSGTNKYVWFDKSPSNKGGLGASTSLGTPSSDDSATGQTDWMIADFLAPVTLSGLWVNGDHAALTDGIIELVVGTSTYGIDCSSNGECDLSYDELAESTISAEDLTDAHFAISAASGIKFYLAGIAWEPAVCIVDQTTGFCDLYTQLQLDIQQWPQGGTVQQLVPEVLLDPRSNPATGRCDGSITVTDPNVDSEGNWEVRPGIVIPWWMCGSPYVALVDTITNFAVEFGVVDHTLLTGLPPDNDITYICQVPPITGDLQKQTVFGWIPDDPNDVIEGRVLELTTACVNPPKGKTRDLSILFAGLHIDFGRDSVNEGPQINSDYQELLIEKSVNLRTAVSIAVPYVSNANHQTALTNLSRLIEVKVRQGACSSGITKVKRFIRKVGQANFTDATFNHEGELLARAENILFTLENKFCPFTN